MSSFYGVVATRFPQGKSIIKPRSHCDFCQHALSFYDLIPVFSFLLLKGKCRYCKKKLPIHEPILELVVGILFALAYSYYGFSYSFFVALLLISLTNLIFVSDFLYMIILDSPLVITIIIMFILKLFYFNIAEAFISLGNGMLMFILMLIIGKLGTFIFKRDALGGGDIKLSFVIGMILGFPHAILALFLSTFLALPYATFSMFSNTSREVPYGPFLVSALSIVFLFYEKFSAVLNLLKFI